MEKQERQQKQDQEQERERKRLALRVILLSYIFEIYSFTWMQFYFQRRIKHFMACTYTHTRTRTHTSKWRCINTLTGTTGNWTTEVFNGCDSRDEISFDYSSKLCVIVHKSPFLPLSLTLSGIFALVSLLSFLNFGLYCTCSLKIQETRMFFLFLTILHV